jgi:hypothetical protein
VPWIYVKIMLGVCVRSCEKLVEAVQEFLREKK